MRQRKKMVCGVGINDADYKTQLYDPITHKRIWICPFYLRWVNVLVRCYSKKLWTVYPTYKDCSVCEEWLTFSKFKSWMEKQDWEGKHLDKDILVPNNKHYSPETCVFVSATLNKFLLKGNSSNNGLPTGVNIQHGYYIALCCNPFTGKQENLGVFSSPEEAHTAWRLKKVEHIHTMKAKELVDEKIYQSLLLNFNHLLMLRITEKGE